MHAHGYTNIHKYTKNIKRRKEKLMMDYAFINA